MGSEPNKEILQRVSQKVGAVSHVETVRPFSVNKPRSVEVTFDADIYPEEISQVYVDIELEFSGDFYIHYVEQWAGRQKECRWDRHKNTHNSRDHFHQDTRRIPRGLTPRRKPTIHSTNHTR